MRLSSSRTATAGGPIWSGSWQALIGTACRGMLRCALLRPPKRWTLPCVEHGAISGNWQMQV